jgi:hypothetical protein
MDTKGVQSLVRSCRFPREVHADLEREAQRRGRSFNNLVIWACRQLLEGGKTAKPDMPAWRPARAQRSTKSHKSIIFWSDDYVPCREAVLARDGKNLFIVFNDERRRYTMRFTQSPESPNEYVGRLVLPNHPEGWPASCRVFQSDGAIVAVGTFVEDGTDYHWCADVVREPKPNPVPNSTP